MQLLTQCTKARRGPGSFPSTFQLLRQKPGHSKAGAAISSIQKSNRNGPSGEGPMKKQNRFHIESALPSAGKRQPPWFSVSPLKRHEYMSDFPSSLILYEGNSTMLPDGSQRSGWTQEGQQEVVGNMPEWGREVSLKGQLLPNPTSCPHVRTECFQFFWLFKDFSEFLNVTHVQGQHEMAGLFCAVFLVQKMTKNNLCSSVGDC